MPRKAKVISIRDRWNGFGRSSYDWVLIGGLVGLSPLLWSQGAHLWQRQHFQFFPIAWAATAFLVISRGELYTAENRLRTYAGFATLVCSLLSFLAAVVIFSPWLGQIAGILVVLGWMLLRLGRTRWHTIAAWCSLLAVTVPLPRNLDSKLVQRLQAWSSGSTSNLLDITATPHLASGNVIKIRTGDLFVEEACSGVDSLYSLAAVALLLAVWHKSSFLVATLSFLTVPLWAWFGNALRLFVIAILLDRIQFDLSHGWTHTMLGLIIFSLAFLSLLMTIKWLDFVFAPFPGRSITSGPLHLFFNRLVSWPKSSRGRKAKKATQDLANNSPVWGTRLLPACFVLIGVASLFPLLAIGPWRDSKLLLPNYSEADIASVFSKTSLPRTLGSWENSDFEQVQRSRDSVFGEHSVMWTLCSGNRTCRISLDLPFDGFHVLEDCYTATGNKVESVTTDPTTNVREIQLKGELGESMYLCYVEFDQFGSFVGTSTEPSMLSRGLMNVKLPPVAYQLQLFVDMDAEPSDQEREMYASLLLDAFAILSPMVSELQVSQ